MSTGFNRSLKISLDDTESKICSLLLKFCHDSQNNSTLRITGGWVRDKLLSKSSHDLDIAIDNSTGIDFAEKLNEYIVANAKDLKIAPHSIHKIERNPDKSKHLETATTKLYGLDVDFVNLRAEEYANKDSRIPSTVRFGTPEEDAKRRDATLNALFYNIQEQKVEDFTKTGVDDLEKGILRTPLDPLETFTEDPLRVLRLIRFRAVFGFSIETCTYSAMANQSIKDAMLQKVSRERVGIEVAKILHSQQPALALKTIYSLGLEDTVFWLPTMFGMGQTPPSVLEKAVDCLTQIGQDVADATKKLHPDICHVLKAKQATIYLTAALMKWGRIEVLNEKKRPGPAIAHIVKEGLRLSSAEGALIARLVASDIIEVSKIDTPTRLQLGLLVRECGSEWKLFVLAAILREMVAGKTDNTDIYRRYSNLIDSIYAAKLENAHSMRPILNGKDVLQTLGVKSAGPWLADMLVQLVKLEIENPALTKQEAVDFVLAHKQKASP